MSSGHQDSNNKDFSEKPKLPSEPFSFGKFFHDFDGPRSVYHFLWAWTSGRLHRHPSEKIFVIGVTGTKGKTTTLELINAILENAGKRTALLSSLRVKINMDSQKNKTSNSMPGRGYIQKFLKAAIRNHCNYALIEVTSQAVVQHRHRFINWNIGVLTNLAPEHIEAHGSFENYRQAKMDFLTYVVGKGGKVFLNRDDKNFGFFIDALEKYDPIAYSKDDEFMKDYLPEIRANQIRRDNDVPQFLLSKFNEENIAVAVAIAKELGISNKIIEDALYEFEGVPGRMEFVQVGEYTAVVDYAHTSDSLEAAYIAARPNPTPDFPNPRFICVLGAAGGGRDAWKRPPMGSIAADYCDEIILTNEDPYDEDPEAIMDEIETGIPQPLPEGQHVYKIFDRTKAIQKAVDLMQPGDVVIGTGKGSEDWIHIAGGKKIPWNERAVFEAALKNKKENPTPQERVVVVRK
jgi:UDP-N-acetylmuramoyl-L-alanyl-D-glutamate--2,6-diaminopimelate ligase